MNAVRKRFARWGAGRLALALAPARTHSFIMSDVLGDDPSDIGSGPCAPDAHTVKDVTEILQKSGLLARISPAMREYLTGVGRGVVPETPKRTHPAFAHVSTRVIGSNHLALDAAKAYAEQIDMRAECVSASLQGDAAICGTHVADVLLQRAAAGHTGCVIWGGETTVQLTAGAPGFAGRGGTGTMTHDGPPSGGRCQELALSAARRLAQGGDAASRLTLLAAGTDGRDGTVDAAGAFADSSLWEAIRQGGRDPELALQRHESHGALGAAGALLPSRVTGTNVMDVVIGLIE